MVTNSRIKLTVFVSLIFPLILFAQKDVTQFLGIPIDGYKPEMIIKLKEKGFSINPYNNDVLDGEFNGSKVNIFIVTNNNKVCRIMIADANSMDEADIRIRFNKLLQQFQNNKKYLYQEDSTILKRTISEDENISYELNVNKKRYEALFYQKTAAYDSLTLEIKTLKEKQQLNDIDIKQLSTLIVNQMEELNKCFNKAVWFMINKRSGQYYISIYYDNEYNRAKGEDL